MLTVQQKNKIYGQPDANGTNTIIVDLPFPLQLSWDPKTYVTRARFHKKAAEDLVAALKEILQVYGLEKIKELGIDRFGGTFNFRPMRGTEKRYDALMASKNYDAAAALLSNHAWGLAIDLDPVRNQLHETSRTARFARPEYKSMIDIFYKHNFISLGREKNYDWMHFEYNKK